MPESNLKTAKLRSQFPIISLGNREKGHPWTMYFVYAPHGNFLVTGGSEAVANYVDKYFPVCLYRYDFWGKGFGDARNHRGNWRANGIAFIERPPRQKNNYGMYSSYDPIESIFRTGYVPPNKPAASRHAKFAIGSWKSAQKFRFYRRLPLKWLPEWNEYVDTRLLATQAVIATQLRNQNVSL